MKKHALSIIVHNFAKVSQSLHPGFFLNAISQRKLNVSSKAGFVTSNGISEFHLVFEGFEVFL